MEWFVLLFVVLVVFVVFLLLLGLVLERDVVDEEFLTDVLLIYLMTKMLFKINFVKYHKMDQKTK